MSVFHNDFSISSASHQTKTTYGSLRCSDRVQPGIAVLWQAHQYAHDVQRDVWEFAVEILNLRQIGLTEADFRWLLCKGLVRHADEITLLGENGRRFRPIGELCFTDRTCFVLAASGVELAEGLFSGRRFADAKSNEAFVFQSEGLKNIRQNGSPHWDSDRHELRLDGQIVKRFKHRSPNQEAILTAFQEEGWPARVDDPLPPIADSEPKRRLNDTIKGLNHHQYNQLIRFRGDGTGEAVLWERTPGDERDEKTPRMG